MFFEHKCLIYIAFYVIVFVYFLKIVKVVYGILTLTKILEG
jgi:hypothetical protein